MCDKLRGCLSRFLSLLQDLFNVGIMSYAWSCRRGFTSFAYFSSFIWRSFLSLYSFFCSSLFIFLGAWQVFAYFKAYRSLVQSLEHHRRFSDHYGLRGIFGRWFEAWGGYNSDLSILVSRGGATKKTVTWRAKSCPMSHPCRLAIAIYFFARHVVGYFNSRA